MSNAVKEVELREGLAVPEYYASCVELEPEVVSEEMARYAGDLAYWSEKQARASEVLLRTEWEMEKLRARLYIEKKESGEGKKPPTEAGVEALITLEPAYQAARETVISAQAEQALMRVRCDAVRRKGDMLTQVAQQRRAEMMGDKRLMDRDALKRAEERGF